MELTEYMSINDKSHIVRSYAKNLLLEISAIKLDKAFNPQRFELIDKEMHRSLVKYFRKKNITNVPFYIAKTTTLETIKDKIDNETILKLDSIETPDSVTKSTTLTPSYKNGNLIEKIATCEIEILKFLLGNRIGLKNLFELLESVEKKEISLSQVFVNLEDHGVDESSQIDNFVNLINSIREAYEANEQLRQTLFEVSFKGENKKLIKRSIARWNKQINKLLSDWHLKENILGAIENKIKDEIDWYNEAIKANINEDIIREKEITLRVKFITLIRDIAEIKKRQITIKEDKEELIRRTLPLVDSIAKDYLNKGLGKEELLGEGRIGLVEALNNFDFQRGYRFTNFAIWWIRQSIIMALVDHNKMTMDITESFIEEIVKMNETSKSLVHKLGREPTANEIAGEMKIDVNRVENVLLNAIEPGEAEKATAEAELATDFDLDKFKEMISVSRISKKPKVKAKKEDVSVEKIKRQAIPSTKKLSEKELIARAKSSVKKQFEKMISDKEVKTRSAYLKIDIPFEQVSSSVLTRNPYISELAKRRANGYCQLCENPAPFIDKDGNPFLETHHIEWLSEGGEDVIKNTVALCPNCHRKMHSLNLKADQKKLEAIARWQDN